MSTPRIIVMGDIHGAFRGRLNQFINVQQPDLVLAAGDFGFWPNWPKHMGGEPSDPAKDIKNFLRNGNLSEIRFCDGNHEDHDALRKLAPQSSREPVEVGPSVFYHPRGSTFTLPDGRVVLFVGGAKSVDWRDRDQGIDWFPEEILLPEDLPEKLPAADIVISHTAPASLPIARDDGRDPRWDHSPDPSREVLDRVFEEVRPHWWYFGHFHKFRRGVIEDCRWVRRGKLEECRWVGLAAAQGGGRWWVELDWWGKS